MFVCYTFLLIKDRSICGISTAIPGCVAKKVAAFLAIPGCGAGSVLLKFMFAFDYLKQLWLQSYENISNNDIFFEEICHR